MILNSIDTAIPWLRITYLQIRTNWRCKEIRVGQIRGSRIYSTKPKLQLTPQNRLFWSRHLWKRNFKSVLNQPSSFLKKLDKALDYLDLSTKIWFLCAISIEFLIKIYSKMSLCSSSWWNLTLIEENSIRWSKKNNWHSRKFWKSLAQENCEKSSSNRNSQSQMWIS